MLKVAKLAISKTYQNELKLCCCCWQLGSDECWPLAGHFIKTFFDAQLCNETTYGIF